MSQIGQAASANFSAQEAASQAGSAGDAAAQLDTSAFLQLMIAEMQNQDPLSPMDSSEMVAQMGQISQIGSTNKLTQTLDNLASSQELVTASTLIGRSVTGLAIDASEVDGVVDRITVETDTEKGSRSIKVHVGGKTMDINNIREIQPG